MLSEVGLGAQVVAALIVQGHIETFGLFVFINPKPHHAVENLKKNETDDAGIHDGGNNAGGLSEQLTTDTTDAVAKSGTTQHFGRKDTSQQGTDDAAHAMNPEYIE